MATAIAYQFPVRDSLNSYLPTIPLPYPYKHKRPSRPEMSQPPDTHLSRSSKPNPSTDDNARMSLPSISNLLGIADANRTDTQQAYDTQRSTNYYDGPTRNKRARYDSVYPRPGSDVIVSNAYATQENSNQPANASSYSRYGPPVDNSQPSISNNVGYPTELPPSDSKRPSQASVPYEGQYTSKPYAASPSGTSDGSLYSPAATMHRQLNPYNQSHPSHPPPPPPPGYSAGINAGPSHVSNLPSINPWEHHHYLSSSAQQGIYPPMPDRYICPTCNKAFSRPSSLKIHSHSHTGEKPFKCPHTGCNKAFSVKSNMKRHEKGCHGGADEGVADTYTEEEA